MEKDPVKIPTVPSLEVIERLEEELQSLNRKGWWEKLFKDNAKTDKDPFKQ